MGQDQAERGAAAGAPEDRAAAANIPTPCCPLFPKESVDSRSSPSSCLWFVGSGPSRERPSGQSARPLPDALPRTPRPGVIGLRPLYILNYFLMTLVSAGLGSAPRTQRRPGCRAVLSLRPGRPGGRSQAGRGCGGLTGAVALGAVVPPLQGRSPSGRPREPLGASGEAPAAASWGLGWPQRLRAGLGRTAGQQDGVGYELPPSRWACRRLPPGVRQVRGPSEADATSSPGQVQRRGGAACVPAWCAGTLWVPGGALRGVRAGGSWSDMRTGWHRSPCRRRRCWGKERPTLGPRAEPALDVAAVSPAEEGPRLLSARR